MATSRNPNVEAAMQYLTWAIEEINKTGHEKAACHARHALEHLRHVYVTGASTKS